MAASISPGLGVRWGKALVRQPLHAEQHQVAEELALELAGQVDDLGVLVDAGSELRYPALPLGAAVQHGEVDGDEAGADLRPQQPPQGGAGHAQPQPGEGEEEAQCRGPEHIVPRVDGARRGDLGGLGVVVGLAGGVLAVEEGAQLGGKPPQRLPWSVGPLQRAAVGIGGLGAEAETLRHVVVDGAVLGRRRAPVEGAGGGGGGEASCSRKAIRSSRKPLAITAGETGGSPTTLPVAIRASVSRNSRSSSCR
jgi:hypothetical protein